MEYVIFSNRGGGDYSRKEDLTFERLEELNPKYVFITFWSWYIPAEIYESWQVIIFHSSDVPFGRGGSPIQNLLIRDHKSTMISALKCAKELDAGPVYMKIALDISQGTSEEIYDKIDRLIRNYMIPYLLAENPRPVPQRGQATYFKRWNPQNAKRII